MSETSGRERKTCLSAACRLSIATCHYASLVKFLLSLFIAISCLWGYILYRPQLSWKTALLTSAIFSLACGAAALNNVQDRLFDLQFSRTRRRPLPSARVSRTVAIAIAAFHIGLGMVWLRWIAGDSFPFALGLASIVLYNGIYTPLKKRTVLSMLPGAVCGMLPPYIGWLVAGGSGWNPVIGSAMLIVGLWQFPHFWLVLIHSDAEFSRARYRNMLRLFSLRQLSRILAMWVVAMFAVVSCLPLIYRFRYMPIYWSIYALGLGMLAIFTISSFQSHVSVKPLFLLLNTFLLALMSGMIADGLL